MRYFYRSWRLNVQFKGRHLTFNLQFFACPLYCQRTFSPSLSVFTALCSNKEADEYYMPTLAMQFFSAKITLGQKALQLDGYQVNMPNGCFCPSALHLPYSHTSVYSANCVDIRTFPNQCIYINRRMVSYHTFTHKKDTKHTPSSLPVIHEREKQTDADFQAVQNTHTRTHTQIHKTMSSNLLS